LYYLIIPLAIISTVLEKMVITHNDRKIIIEDDMIGEFQIIRMIVILLCIYSMSVYIGLTAIIAGSIFGNIIAGILLLKTERKKLDSVENSNMSYARIINSSFITVLATSAFFYSDNSSIVGAGFVGLQIVSSCWRFVSSYNGLGFEKRIQRQDYWPRQDRIHYVNATSRYRRFGTAALACLFLCIPLLSHLIFGGLEMSFVGPSWLVCLAYGLLLQSTPSWLFLRAHGGIRDPYKLAVRAFVGCGVMMLLGTWVYGSVAIGVGLLACMAWYTASLTRQSYRLSLKTYGPSQLEEDRTGFVFVPILTVVFGVLATPLMVGGVVAAAMLASFSIVIVILALC